MAAPDPGWYPDPDAFGGRRYFDGANWTDQRQAPPPPPPQLPLTAKQRGLRQLRWGLAISIGALIVVALAVQAWWPPSAADRRHEDAKKTCTQLLGQAGITKDHLDSQVLAAYDDCVTRLEQPHHSAP